MTGTVRLLVVAGLLCAAAIRAETVGDVIYDGTVPPKSNTATATLDKARTAYTRFLAGAADSPHRATALRRLADLEVEAGLRVLESDGHAAFDRPIALYTEYLSTYPEDPARDQVLYQLSRALDNAGHDDAALERLRELITQYPDSSLNAEALFRQGEMLFVRRDYSGAANAYATLYERHRETRFESNARYKHGWALFKIDRYRGAISAFAGLIDHVLAASTPVADQIEALSPGQREMFEDALRASSIALTELGGAAQLAILFDDDALPVWGYLFYERLGVHYLSEQRYAEAARSFAAFAERLPGHAQAPILQARVIDTYEAAGFSDQAMAARADFVRAYGFDASFWAGRETAGFPDIAIQLDKHLQVLTTHYHALAQRSGDPAVVAMAVAWYRKWLSYFPTEPQTPARHFLLSELLFDAGRLDEAALEYERTAYEYPQHERASEAGYAALLTRDRAYAAARANVAGTTSGLSDDLIVLHQFALDSKLRFADRFPDDPHTAAVLLRAAEALYAVTALEEAITVATRALEYPDVLTPTQQRTAWIVQAHAWFDLGAYENAEPAYAQALILSTPDDAMSADLQQRLAATVYERGRQMRESGELAAAAEHFLRVASLNFTTSVHPVALYDAASAYIALEQWPAAADALVSFRLRYADHPLAAGIAEQLTGVYLQGDRPLAAAEELSRMATTATAAPATAARWQAAQLYADNDETAAHLDMLRTLADAPTTPPDDAMRARAQLLAAYVDRSDTASATHWHERIVAADAAAGPERSDYSRTLAARSALALAEPLVAAFDAIKLTLPLEPSLVRKKTALEDALSAFEHVADYAIDETSTASTFRIAQLYQHFGTALMDSPRPDDLDELALEEYEFLLEETAFPFEEKAIEIYEINTARAASLIYDEWVAQSYAQLALLLPARYNKVEQHESLVTIYD